MFLLLVFVLAVVTCSCQLSCANHIPPDWLGAGQRTEQVLAATPAAAETTTPHSRMVWPVQWQTAFEHLDDDGYAAAFGHKAYAESEELVGAEEEEEEKSSNEGEIKHAHDIYLKLHGPRRISFGHVEQGPDTLTRSFNERDEGEEDGGVESGKAGSAEGGRQSQRYSGKVLWADLKGGGYGEHYWNLAQGAL